MIRRNGLDRVARAAVLGNWDVEQAVISIIVLCTLPHSLSVVVPRLHVLAAVARVGEPRAARAALVRALPRVHAPVPDQIRAAAERLGADLHR